MDIDSLLKTYQRFGVHLGLERIEKLLTNLGNPHQLPVIHVAGSNGKGSVCAYLSSVLTAAGYRTGRYISPHLVNWTERICVNEQEIKAEDLYKLLQQVEAAITPGEVPTQFEIITAAAWLYFAQQQVDIAVVEVGLGGRLDATNVCEQPLVTIITSISREHWQQLGSTVAEIATEKAGILKTGCPAVIGQLPPDAEKVVRSRIQELQCPVYIPEPAREIESGWAEYCGYKYPLPLQGQIQLANSALALTALSILQNQGWEKITQQAIVNGMAKTKWPGRMQWTTWKNHKLLLDGAHNSASAKVLRDYLDNQENISWVMGMLSTKDHREIFQALVRSHDRLYLVPVPDHSSANPNELAKLALEVQPQLDFCSTYPDLSAALEAAFSQPDNLVVLCGSLYLIGHFLRSQYRGL